MLLKKKHKIKFLTFSLNSKFEKFCTFKNKYDSNPVNVKFSTVNMKS